MARPGVRTGLVAGALVAVLGAAGCGGEPVEPEPLETSEPTSASPTPTPTPSPSTPSQTPSTRPGETEEMAFVRQFVDAINSALRTGDSSGIRELSTDDCEGCKVTADGIEQLHRAGGKYIGDPSYRLDEFTGRPEGSDPVQLEAYITQEEFEYIEKRGAKPKTSKKDSTYFTSNSSRRVRGGRCRPTTVESDPA